MEAVTWIEIDDGRHRERPQRQRIDADVLTLGRAWDNDIVLDDPHVAAHHLRLLRGADGRWIAHDLGSRNGMQVEGRRGTLAQVEFERDTVLRIGHTTLRLHRGDEPVPAELPLLRGSSPWPLALGGVALVLCSSMLDLWLGETGEPKLVRYLTALLALALVIVLWTSAWAVISRIFHGHASFGRHLRIAAGGLLVYSIIDTLAGRGAFALSAPALTRYLYVVGWLVFGATCFMHLRALGSARGRLKAVAVGALAALGIATQSLKLADMRASSGQPQILQRLGPPWLRLGGTQPQAAFFDAAGALRADLDAARDDAPADGDEAEPVDD